MKTFSKIILFVVITLIAIGYSRVVARRPAAKIKIPRNIGGRGIKLPNIGGILKLPNIRGRGILKLPNLGKIIPKLPNLGGDMISKLLQLPNIGGDMISNLLNNPALKIPQDIIGGIIANIQKQKKPN